ncbi:HNH endonuclease [Stenotrophomonas phage Paxi]|uniref:HNH endonuclease n=1 Tax=Stenotrophomonas phage Paxi TaxID=2859653 RepID=A0AAE8BHR7_9CAUD|nr:HNH endonuclease [Stenotrophomonas phage Paxi]QYW01794.1 HNH endonuclease [Stenotrophomonas phage Paxi]
MDHLCNQRKCCNPQHLELVTHLQNQRRRVKRAKD